MFVYMDAMIAEAARHAQVAPELVYGSCQTRRASYARAIIAWCLCRKLHLSINAAGRRLKKDKSTIIHALRRIDAAIEADETLRKVTEAVARAATQRRSTRPDPAVQLPPDQTAAASWCDHPKTWSKAWYAEQNAKYASALQREHGDAKWPSATEEKSLQPNNQGSA